MHNSDRPGQMPIHFARVAVGRALSRFQWFCGKKVPCPSSARRLRRAGTKNPRSGWQMIALSLTRAQPSGGHQRPSDMDQHVKSTRDQRDRPKRNTGTTRHHPLGAAFSKFSQAVAHAMGTATAFALATVTILIWAITGPIFQFSDTWQLVINTGTTIVTFLMVFLIQHTQNRDTLALQLKLAELIIAMKGAENSVATIEDLPEEQLEELHKKLCAHADAAGEALESRREQPART
jgi:low affinity Fe/Cu permease